MRLAMQQRAPRVRPANPFRPGIERVEARVLADAGSRNLTASQAETYPFAAVVRIESRYADRRVEVGTGVMVGVYQVLTARHVVINARTGQTASSITVTPGISGGTGPYGSASGDVSNILDFGTSKAAGDDLALFTIDAPLGGATGVLEMGILGGKLQRRVEVHAVGYAGGGTTMVDATGPFDSVRERLIQHKAPTEKGMSGGPVWIGSRESSDLRLVGIQQSKSTLTGPGKTSKAVPLTMARIRQIKAYIDRTTRAIVGLAVPQGTRAWSSAV